jgi:hypothetical protein
MPSSTSAEKPGWRAPSLVVPIAFLQADTHNGFMPHHGRQKREKIVLLRIVVYGSAGYHHGYYSSPIVRHALLRTPSPHVARRALQTCSLPHLRTRSRTQDGEVRELVPKWIVQIPLVEHPHSGLLFTTVSTHTTFVFYIICYSFSVHIFRSTVRPLHHSGDGS